MSELDIYKVISAILALMIAIIGHEIMHGYVAYKYGDTTAKNQGRLSINPIKHIDLVGTIILPGLLFITGAPFMFGWAKPVPINTSIVLSRGGNFGMFNVAMAGIAFNVLMATTASLLIGNVGSQFLNLLLFNLVIYNVVLALFNLLPIPPLDGSQVISYLGLMLGSAKIALWFDKIGRYGIVILVLFLMSPLSAMFFNIVREVILWLVVVK
jgi:Zn-dependent protease